MATLTVNVGAMFSGKSTLLISQGEKHVRAGQRVLYIKPSMDNRYSENEIVTHTGIRVKALNVETHEQLIKKINIKEVDVVLIDEVQFFTGRIVDSVWALLEKGIRVYCSGLDMNYLGEHFETTSRLMAISDKVNKLKAVCEGCGSDAVLTGKRNAGASSEVVQLGAEETYKPLCRKCFIKECVCNGYSN